MPYTSVLSKPCSVPLHQITKPSALGTWPPSMSVRSAMPNGTWAARDNRRAFLDRHDVLYEPLQRALDLEEDESVEADRDPYEQVGEEGRLGDFEAAEAPAFVGAKPVRSCERAEDDGRDDPANSCPSHLLPVPRRAHRGAAHDQLVVQRVGIRSEPQRARPGSVKDEEPLGSACRASFESRGEIRHQAEQVGDGKAGKLSDGQECSSLVPDCLDQHCGDHQDVRYDAERHARHDRSVVVSRRNRARCGLHKK
eukprot:5363897-Prymnesium_polylepis.1